jgi:hypothetical protein
MTAERGETMRADLPVYVPAALKLRMTEQHRQMCVRDNARDVYGR